MIRKPEFYHPAFYCSKDILIHAPVCMAAESRVIMIIDHFSVSVPVVIIRDIIKGYVFFIAEPVAPDKKLIGFSVPFRIND